MRITPLHGVVRETHWDCIYEGGDKHDQNEALHVARRISSKDVLDQLYELFLNRGTPEYIRSDNAHEFASNAVRGWLRELGVRTLFIEPGSPWENGYVESYIGKLRDELLHGEILDTLKEAKVLVGG